MEKSINHLKNVFNLNARLFLNTLEGVSDEQAQEQIAGHINPIIWIAAHTLWARINTILFLGSPAENPYNDLFENFKPYDPSLNYPALSKIKSEWNGATTSLNAALGAATEEHLSAEAPIKNPTGDFTNGGTVAFLAQHESYDIGQLGLLKKFFTKEAMSYN